MNAPPLLAILMATVVRRGDTDGIAQCSMFRAIPEATGRHHWATTCSVLPQKPPGQQANKQQRTNTPTLLAISMAMVMCRCVTARILQWRRSRASLEATERRHQVSILSDNIKGAWLRWFFYVFHCQHVQNGQVAKGWPQ
jgi:hypothetical protein